jgi:hypothetical protein
MKCQQAAEVITCSVDKPLSALQKLNLGIHTLFCGPCRRFQRQVNQLHASSEEALSEEATPTHIKLPVEARDRIKSRLDATAQSE